MCRMLSLLLTVFTCISGSVVAPTSICTLLLVVPVALAAAAAADTPPSTTSRSGVASSSSQSHYFVRSNNNNNNFNRKHRALQEKNIELFIPSFSQDEASISEVAMPTVTLVLEGVGRGGGDDNLGEEAYDTIQTTMNEYLTTIITTQPAVWTTHHENYDLLKARTEITNDRPYATGHAITMNTILTFREPTPPPPNRADDDNDDTDDEAGIGDSSSSSSSSRTSSSSSIPTPEELEYLAGVAWNELTVYQNMLVVAATIDAEATLQGVTAITADPEFPLPPNAGASNAPEEGRPEGTGVEAAGAEGETPIPSNNLPPETTTSTTTRDEFNVAAAAEASSQFAEAQDLQEERLNPLWPALIVGFGVFLCTILMLGYRRQRQHQRRRSSGSGYKRQSPEDEDAADDDTNTSVRVHDRSLNLGADFDDNDEDVGRDDEFEIEKGAGNNNDMNTNVIDDDDDDYDDDDDDDDQQYNSKEPTMKKQKKWWSKKLLSSSSKRPASSSCTTAMHNSLNTTILIEDDDRQGYDTADHIAYRGLESDAGSSSYSGMDPEHDGIGRRSCFRMPSLVGLPKQPRGREIIHECNSRSTRSDDDTGSRNTTRSIDLTGNIVTNNTTHNESSWRNPHGIINNETQDEDKLYNDLDKMEKEKIATYMQQGLTLEEASRRVLYERNTPNHNIPYWKRQQQVVHPKTEVPLGGPSQLQTEVMKDSQPKVHGDRIINGGGKGIGGSGRPSNSSSNALLLNPCSSSNLNVLKNVADDDTKDNVTTIVSEAQQHHSPMVISDAVSNVSSSYTYTNSEFARAVEELDQRVDDTMA